MKAIEAFSAELDASLEEEFLHNGYVIVDVCDPDLLDLIRAATIEYTCRFLAIEPPNDSAQFLNGIHKIVPVDRLNALRLAVYHQLDDLPWFRPTYFRLAQSTLETLVGNELVMQNRVNLSIQYPADDSSLLSLHSDSWSGESPFQVVQWLPLVDVHDTKTMYIMKPAMNRQLAPQMRHMSKDGGSKKAFEEFEQYFDWPTVRYGKVLIFSSNLMHGNVMNQVPETRWSFNCRFKSLFSPYASAEKGLGNFYLPITTRVVTRVGLEYRNPEDL